MNTNELTKIKKLYFTYRDVAQTLGISENAAIVTCSRYVKSGVLLRLKRNLYMNRQKWEYLTVSELYEISNMLQVPSYISLTTAISYYGYSTQIQQDFFESIATNRTVAIEILDSDFNYSKISKSLYYGFVKKENFFIALPEKAILDALYLQFLGRYRLDISSIDMEKIEPEKMQELAAGFPDYFKLYLKRSIKN